MIGVRDLFRIGIGPSSSHTVGPMKAAASFAAALNGTAFSRVQCDLLGSLAWTGKGHVTDKAVILGLAGFLPDTIEPEQIDALVEKVRAVKRLHVAGRDIQFDPDRDVIFDREGATPIHPNTLRFIARDTEGVEILTQRWCSIGGGFIAPEDLVGNPVLDEESEPPFPFRTAEELLAMCERNGLSIAEVVRANERCRMSDRELQEYLDRIIDAMMDCIERGMRSEGILPGRLQVPRRAKESARSSMQTGSAIGRYPMPSWIMSAFLQSL